MDNNNTIIAAARLAQINMSMRNVGMGKTRRATTVIMVKARNISAPKKRLTHVFNVIKLKAATTI